MSKRDEYTTVDELFESSDESDLGKRVREKVRQRDEGGVLDKYTIQQQITWSILANQIVGGEVGSLEEE